MVVTTDVRRDAKRRTAAEWQDKALAYCDTVPEAWYASQFYARALMKLILGVGEITGTGEDGQPEIEPSKNERALEVFNRIQDPGGGRSKLLQQYGRLQFVTGEGYLVGYRRDDDDDESWEFLSHKEFRLKPGSETAYQRVEAPGLKPWELDAVPDDSWQDIPQNGAVVARLWRPHMAYSWWADSPMRAVLDTCEELLLLTQSIHARATNRAAGPGILYVPNSIANAITAPEPQSAEESQMSPLMRVLTRGLLTPIGDPGHASAVVPVILTGPDESGALIQKISLYDQTSEWPEIANRKAAQERFAVGADFPKEYLMGLSDTNHWNAWEIDDDTWAMHVQPVVEMLVGDLTAAVYRPMLKAAGLEAPEKFVITYDESEVVTRPDKGPAAKDGYDRGIVNGAAYRRETGFDDETDKMDDDEYRRWVGIQVKDANLALGGDVTPPPQPPQPGPPPSGGDGGEDRAPPSRNGSAPETSQTARILGAAELAIAVGREKAGSRMWSKAASCPDCRDKCRNVPRSMVAHTLGPDGLPGKTPPPGVLVEGASELFLQRLLTWGVSLPTATFLADAVHSHAARTLYDPDPVGLPPELIGYAEDDVGATV
jgi:hypothetical protein